MDPRRSSSYASVRKAANDAIMSTSLAAVKANLDGKSPLGSTSSKLSIGIRAHPIVQWLLHIQSQIMNSVLFRKTIALLASDRARILMWYFVIFWMYTAVIAMFILSVQVVMPGLWVYNFLQLFVITCAIVAHIAATRLSKIVRTSIAAGDLIKGRLTFFQLVDYWIDGPRAPASNVLRSTAYFEIGTDVVLIASSILFSWSNMETRLMTDLCIPPNYHNSSLPFGIDVGNYLQGSIDMAEVYNYGLPLADGLVGGWAGWPKQSPMASFQINGQGPIYVMRVLCNDGIPRPELDPGIYTLISTSVTAQDAREVMMEMRLTFPAGSVFVDAQGAVENSTVVQDCTIMVSMGYGSMSYHFVKDQWNMVTNAQVVSLSSPKGEFSSSYPSSITQYSADAHDGFLMYEDAFGAFPLVQQVMMLSFENASYSPTQGATFCNLLSEATLPDGYYHTKATYRGVATALGTAIHLAFMQYNSSATPVSCDYFGFDGSGMLSIPATAIYFSAAASALACLMKAFEIMWWFMAQNSVDYQAYRRARRSLRHPLRFAIDAAEMLATGMKAGERGEDICDATTTRVIEELGNARIMYGEDIVTRDMEKGHLRIAEFGKVKSVLKDKRYGTFRVSQNPEWDEFMEK
ncbi:hypothetical protein HDU98_007014 [Podochytrium sp. JEL0797]|nr:hypothetical protein HDU98_007014 [Podochytrium sp. JEL0797]